MTDPKELAQKVRAAAEFIETDLPEYGEIADALDTLARNTINDQRGMPTPHLIETIGHLVDAVRKLTEERDAARAALDEERARHAALQREANGLIDCASQATLELTAARDALATAEKRIQELIAEGEAVRRCASLPR